MNYVKNNPCNLNKNMNYNNNIHVKQSTNQAFSLICTRTRCTSQNLCYYCLLEQKLLFLCQRLRILAFSYQRYGKMLGCDKQTIWRAMTERIRNNRMFVVGDSLRREKKGERHLFYTIKITLSDFGKKLLHAHVDERNSFNKNISIKSKNLNKTSIKNIHSFTKAYTRSLNSAFPASFKDTVALRAPAQKCIPKNLQSAINHRFTLGAHVGYQATHWDRLAYEYAQARARKRKLEADARSRALRKAHEQESTQSNEIERAKVLERLAQLGFKIA